MSENIPQICCVVCNKVIPSDRVEALLLLNKQPHEYTCIEHAPNTKVKGLFIGESGNSQLIITDNLGQREGIIKENHDTVFDK